MSKKGFEGMNRDQKGEDNRKWGELLTEWFLIFLVFSIIGWLYEVGIMWFELHMGFINRGFLFGPYLPIYGIGGVLILLTAGRLRKRPILCFMAICLLTTGIELLASYLLEQILGEFLWDYRDTGFGPTFEGRIALRSSLQFGLIGLCAVYVVYPLVHKGIEKFRGKFPRIYHGMALIIMALFLFDLGMRPFLGSNAPW
ncbi:MAG: putative ABC transporter permease [Lachnospiraceae bacterium]|nr:putative ABC transporter permease [Lachnospiraceae bacterium]